LYYFRARYYDPEVRRFISSDPAKDGLNWYGYADGNPLVFVDPDGRASTTAEPIGRYPSDVFTIVITTLLAAPMIRTAITVKDLLWSKITAHVDTMTTTEQPDKKYILLAHFTDEAFVPAIKTARALRPGRTGFVFLTMPDMIGKPVAQVERELALAPGRGSWVFLVRIEPEEGSVPGDLLSHLASGQVPNPGGAAGVHNVVPDSGRRLAFQWPN